MAVALRREKFYTPEEYLAMEEAADFKSEYYQGAIYAMAGGSYNHEVICGNMYSALRQSGDTRPCLAFASNMKLLIEAHTLYTYPDAMLICGKPKFEKGRKDTVLNPLVLVEVLSRSTQGYDRGQKFEFYRAISTFREYVLIDQARVYVEYHHKLEMGQWVLSECKSADDILTLQSINLEVPVRMLYKNVDWFAP